jgi:hypothetical protein
MRRAGHHSAEAAIRVLDLRLARHGWIDIRAEQSRALPGRQSGQQLAELLYRHELLPGHDAPRLITSRIDTVTHSLVMPIAIWK